MEPVKTPKQRQGEEEANHEQELEHIKGHTHSRCLKWEAWRSSLRSKDKESHQCCQAIGREVRIVHHHETLYQYIGSMVSSIPTIVSPSLFQGITEKFLHMAAFNIRSAGLEVLPKLSFFDNQLTQLYENIGQLITVPLQTQLAQLSRIKIPEPFLSDTMLISGLNSPLVHTSTYILPKVEPIRKREELPRRAEEAIQHRLVDAYDILSRLELSLRSLIEIKLREIYGDRWWRRGVPENVRIECEERKRKEEKRFEAGHHPIHYAYLGHCKDIIMRGDNWQSSFSAVFGKKTEFEVFIDWVQKVRLPIGHPRPISDDDYLLFTASARWLQMAIDRAITQGI